MSELSLKQSYLWILLSVCIISGGSTLAWLYYAQIRQAHTNNEAYRIVAIVQTSSERELLPTAYFAELLDLSVDNPLNLYRFNTKEARKKLLASPLIKEVSVKRIRPGTVYLDYIPRVPIAFLLDYNNTVIDKEGYIFPFKPFFTPKKLPEIYLGIQLQAIWGESIKDKSCKLAFDLMDYLENHCCSKNQFIKRIDVSRAFDSSYGRREIVIVLEGQQERQITDHRPVLLICEWILRLSPNEHLHKAINSFIVLEDRLIKEQPILQDKEIQRSKFIIDLRLQNLAFVLPQS